MRTPSTTTTNLILILTLGLTLRVGLLLTHSATIPFNPSLVSITVIDDLNRENALFDQWWQSWFLFQGLSYVELSPLASLPLIGGLALFGPSLFLASTIGIALGMISIALAFLLGTQLRGERFGALLALFVAVSPVQVAWSMIGGLYQYALPHVLFALLLAHRVTKTERTSSLLFSSAALGTVCWLSVYNYYAARVCLPLSLGWLLLFLQTSRARWLSTGTFLLTVLTAYTIFSSETLIYTFWPQLPGVWQIADSPLSIWTQATEIFRNYAQKTAELLFLFGRGDPILWQGWRNDPSRGGAVLLPTLVCGVWGALLSVRHGKREVFWFGFLFLTFLLSAISGAEIRRLLLFDFGWCYFAALGALPLVNRLSLPATALLFAPVGLYGLLAIQTILVNPPEEISALPFGSGRLGEGITCYSCYQRGLLWREDFSRGRAVILVDSDEQRETVLNPGGLALYGELAAREFGARERFLQFYPVLKNRKVEHPKLPAPYFDSGDGFDFITPRIAGTEVVWHFEQPTPEEQPLIHALSALAAELGGTVERSSHLYVRTIRGTLPKDTIRIVFPASAAQQSIERIRALAPLPPPERG